VTPTDDALARLPADARLRLDAFARALERIPVDDLPLHVRRVRQPVHRRAVEAAELVASEHRLGEPLRAARQVMLDGLFRAFANGQFRVWLGGEAMAPNLGPVDERVRIAESVSDAVTAIVLDHRLDPDVHAELIGLWDRLLP
jgi:hypothetical protein